MIREQHRKPSSYIKPKGPHHVHRYVENDKGVLRCICGKVMFKEKSGLKEKKILKIRSVNQKRMPPPKRVH